jgi:Fur family ferric uptake transcriptional regulator
MARKNPPLDAAKAVLRQAGLRCTAARLAVLDHLSRARGPKSHAEVADALSDRGFDRATIYRNLTELTESKLVSRVELGDHVWRFEMKRGQGAGQKARAHDTEDHPHFLCTTCGEVSCLDDVSVDITPKKNSVIRAVTEVLLKGRCENCE